MPRLDQHQATHYLSSKLLAQHGIKALFTLRTGGVSPAPFHSQNHGVGIGDLRSNVQQNMNLLLTQTGLSGIPHQVEQVHQNSVEVCCGQALRHPCQADGLLTTEAATPLAIRTADCLALLLADPETGITAAVHAGWRGTAANITTITIQKMIAHGAKVQNILVAATPAIGSCCFQIKSETADALRHCCQDADRYITYHNSHHHYQANLYQINRLQLLHAGVLASHVEPMQLPQHADIPVENPPCTCCHKALFYSYRRDGKQTGRHLAVVERVARP